MRSLQGGLSQRCLSPSYPRTPRTQISTLPENSRGSSPSLKPSTALCSPSRQQSHRSLARGPEGKAGVVPPRSHTNSGHCISRPKSNWGEGRVTWAWASRSDASSFSLDISQNKPETAVNAFQGCGKRVNLLAANTSNSSIFATCFQYVTFSLSEPL